MSVLWPFRRSTEAKKDKERLPSELRIATSGSFSIRATVETLKVDGAGSYAQPGKVRAALFVPTTVTTVQFYGDGQKRPGANARSSCVHVLQMFTQAETASILDDAKRIGGSIGWCAPAAARSLIWIAPRRACGRRSLPPSGRLRVHTGEALCGRLARRRTLAAVVSPRARALTPRALTPPPHTSYARRSDRGR